MTVKPFRLAGNALIWKSIQLVGSKVIFLVRLVILARLLSPDDFGLMAIAVTAIGFMLSLTDFGMIPALVQGTDENEERYDIAWTIGFTRSLLVSLIVFALAPLIAAMFAEPRSADIIRVIALRPLLDGLVSIKVAKLNRDLYFRPLTIIGISQALINTVISIILAPAYGVWALVFGTLAGSLVYLVSSYIVAPYRPRLRFDSSGSRPLIRFGRWIFLTSLVVMAGSYLLRVSISRQLGTAELGLYYLAIQIAFLPTEVANEVIEPVAFTLFSRIQEDLSALSATFRSILSGTAALLLPVCALIIALAPTLVNDILGPNWAGTVPIIRILTLVTAIDLLGEVTAPLFKGMGQPYRFTIVEATQSLMLVGFVLLFAGSFGLIGAAFAWLPAVGVGRFVSFVFVKKLLDRPFSGLWLPLSTVVVVSAIGGLVAIGIDSLTPGILGFILSALAGVVVIVLFLLITDRWFKLGFFNNLLLFFPQIVGLPGFSRLGKDSVTNVGNP